MTRLHLLDSDDAELLGRIRDCVFSCLLVEGEHTPIVALLDRLIGYATAAPLTATAADVAEAAAASPGVVASLRSLGSEHETPPAWQRRVFAATIDRPPPITDSRAFDWRSAEAAAKLIAKACYDAGYSAPEDLDRHVRLVRRVSDAMCELAAALRIQPGVRP